MSDLKLYRILETFDELESATDKLTEYKVNDAPTHFRVDKDVADDMYSYGAGIWWPLAGDFLTPGNDNPEGFARWLEEIGATDVNVEYSHKDDAEKVYKEDVNETDTKVQTMGNKVKVTTDGDTTEFDDAETAKAMMGGDDDDNQFATEEVDVELKEDDWDLLGGELELGDLGGDDLTFPDAPPAEFGIGDDEWMAPVEEACMEDDDEGPEFATFDSENEAHRKRLQRGTPVVLSPELFSDPDGNRRGVFVNRSPSGSFGTVVRDVDGKEVNVHLSDIVSADLVNNSIYEEFGINFDKLLAEDITMTQTTNLENPENDTTTVTAVGSDAGEELAAMMANAGLNTNTGPGAAAGGYDEVDTGEPVASVEPDAPVPVEMPMSGMLDMMDYPEVAQEGFDDDEFGNLGDEFDAEPTDADLDSIETDLNWDFDESIEEAGEDPRQGDRWSKDEFGNPIFTPMTRDQAMASDGPVSDVEKVLTKFDDADISQWLDGGNDAVDEALYAISFEDMPYGIQKARTGDPSEWLYDHFYQDIAAYAKDNFGALGEERDIEHANTPDELEMGVDMVTHGTSGGLNRPKNMYKPAGNRHGDNAMAVQESADEIVCPDCEGDGPEDGVECRRCDGSGKIKSVDETFVNEHESVDNFLNLYKAFSIRGEKK